MEHGALTPSSCTSSNSAELTILTPLNSITPVDKNASTTTSINTASTTSTSEAILSNSNGVTHSNSNPIVLPPTSIEATDSNAVSSSHIRDSIPSTSGVTTHSAQSPQLPGPGLNELGKSRKERCFVRCLRRIGDNNNSNRHLILETGDKYWVGRSDENQLSLPYATLSRKHAEIKEESDGWTIMDNKSSNGTKVKNDWLTPMKPLCLVDKDVIQFGPDDSEEGPGAVKYMFHKALKFSRHPSIPAKAIVNAEGDPLASMKRGHDEADQTVSKRLRADTESHGDGEKEEEEALLAYRKQMMEMEERLRRQDEEMEAMTRKAIAEKKMLAEGEALAREKMRVESEKSKAEIAENLRDQILMKEAAHAEEMERVRREFETDKAKLESQAKSTAKSKEEEMAKTMAAKEKELADNLATAAAELEKEKLAMEEKMKAEWEAKQEEEERRVAEEIEQRRKALMEDQERLEKEADEKKKALETELRNQKEQADAERENRLKVMKEAYVAEMKAKEAKMRAELDRQKKNLEEERNVIEQRLQVEMNEKLEEKDKSLRDELIKERDRITNEIQMRQAKETQLETEIASLNMAQEDTETESKRKILSSLEDTMEEELQCSICTELLIEATSLNCSHSFCAFCLKEWKKNKNECPVCRARITTETRSLVLDSYIDKMVVHLSDDMRERRQENQKFREEQKQGMHQPQPGPSVSDDDEDEDEDDEDEDRYDSDRWDRDRYRRYIDAPWGRRYYTDGYSDGSISGDPDEEYGGYGECHNCGRGGHWVAGCPF